MEFNYNEFRFAHGKSPKGYGHWGFCDYSVYLTPAGNIFWFAGSFTDAKKAAKAFFKGKAYEVVVCP